MNDNENFASIMVTFRDGFRQIIENAHIPSVGTRRLSVSSTTEVLTIETGPVFEPRIVNFPLSTVSYWEVL